VLELFVDDARTAMMEDNAKRSTGVLAMPHMPSDPVWKRDYSGSVRRLVRDGVDTPLASLFVHAARAFPGDADGVDRARSATEAFLFRLLETLPGQPLPPSIVPRGPSCLRSKKSARFAATLDSDACQSDPDHAAA